jgi:hypothetical protein
MSLRRRTQISELTLEHELAIIDCRAALHTALKETEGTSLEEFCTDSELTQFHAFHPATRTTTVVKPDAFIRIRQTESDGSTGERTFFFELDRSHEAQRVLETKVACYRDFYKRGGLAARFGEDPSKFDQFPFRVLIVCMTVERRNNVAERLLRTNPPVRSFVALTTYDELIAGALNPIWMQPGDYMTATAGTAFDPKLRHVNETYRRRIDRDEMINRARILRRLIE